MNWKKTVSNIINKRIQFWFYVFIAIIASVQLYLLGDNNFAPDPDLVYTHYNNYVIFKQSYFHLITHQDIYQLYPDEHWDLYKYSPSFSLFFGLFAYLPDVLGISLWNLLNSLVFFFSIWFLPNLSQRQKGFMLLFVFVEMLTSLQNTQSNGLMAGLAIFAFGFLERKQIVWASLMIVLSIYIKIFGLVAFAIFLFSPQKLKGIGWALFWGVLLFILPIVFLGKASLLDQYECWWYLLDQDYSLSHGYSVMGWLESWFKISVNKLYVILGGIVLFLLPLTQFNKYKSFHFRLLTLASVLLWVVIFNHKAESPTFIIALAGVALWYFSSPPNNLNTRLLLLAFIFTSLTVTDLFPRNIKFDFFNPYVIKAVPSILIWFKLVLWDMWQETEFSS